MAASSVAMDPSTEATGVSRARSLFLNVGFVLALLLGWQAIVEAEWVPRYLFPGPIAVASSLLEMLRDGTMIESLRLSLGRMLIGYGLSVVGGIAIGLLVARHWVFKQTFGAVILSLQSLPSICWLPIALIWVGLNERAVVVVVVLGAIFSIAVATESAVRNIAPIHLKVGRVMGARGLVFARDILFFASLPELIGGLKLGWTFAWRSLMAAELIRQDLFGVGRLLETGRSFNDTAMMIAAMLVILAVGITVDRLVFGVIERRVRRRWGLEKS